MLGLKLNHVSKRGPSWSLVCSIYEKKTKLDMANKQNTQNVYSNLMLQARTSLDRRRNIWVDYSWRGYQISKHSLVSGSVRQWTCSHALGYQQGNVYKVISYTPWNICTVCASPSRWRHNERHGVSHHRRLECLLNRLFRRRSKKTSKLRVTGLCEGNLPVTGGFPSQRANSTENVSIWWRHVVISGFPSSRWAPCLSSELCYLQKWVNGWNINGHAW